MDPLAVLLVIALIIIGFVIICNATKNMEGLTLASESGAILIVTTNIQDASRLIDQAVRASTQSDVLSFLKQASEKLQAAIDNLTQAEKQYGSKYTDAKNQAISAKNQLDSLIKQAEASQDANILRALQQGAINDFQGVLGSLNQRLSSILTSAIPSSVVTTYPVYVEPEPTYYVRPIYIPPRPYPRPPFPGPRPPFPGPGPRPPFPGPGPRPPGPGPRPPGPGPRPPGPGPRPPRM